MNVVKKDLTVEPFDDQKIVDAVNKSASRVMVELTNDDYKRIIDLVWDELIADDIDENTTCTVEELHNAVESALDEFNPKIAKSYKDYRIHSELHQRTLNHISHDCCMSKTRVQSIKKSSERLNSFEYFFFHLIYFLSLVFLNLRQTYQSNRYYSDSDRLNFYISLA